jgi:hypothetical protein
MWAFPHSLSYFNESIGGPLNGPKHLLGSNVDWGQDLRYLKWWRDRQRDGLPLHLAYFACFNPADVGFHEALPISSRELDASQPNGTRESEQTEHPNQKSYFAVSVQLLYGDLWPASDGGIKPKYSLSTTALSRLRDVEPFSYAGYSNRIYAHEIQ